jgi:hypothetical protein
MSKKYTSVSNKFFLYIVEKYFDSTNNICKLNTIYSQKYLYFSIDKTDFNKFIFFIDVLTKTLMPDYMKMEFINIFNKVQKVNYALNKLAFLYKYKKSKIVVDHDLCLNKLDLNNKLTFCLYQDKNKYLFNLNEIVKVIVIALIHSPSFFSEPLVSKNPYNNVPFNKSTLYNIYFTLKMKNMKIHEIFYKFFLENFDLTNFKKYNEHLIREYAIDSYIKNLSEQNTYDSILSMLIEYNKFVNLKDRFKFSSNFPRNKIIQAFKPFLNLYYKSKYSLIQIIKSNSTKYLFATLFKFRKLNYCFGRKMYTLEIKYVGFSKKFVTVMYYYDSFKTVELRKPNFLNSHLLSNEENIDVLLSSLYHNWNINYNQILTNNENIYYPISDNDNEQEEEQDEDEEEDEEEQLQEEQIINDDEDTDEETTQDINQDIYEDSDEDNDS